MAEVLRSSAENASGRKFCVSKHEIDFIAVLDLLNQYHFFFLCVAPVSFVISFCPGKQFGGHPFPTSLCQRTTLTPFKHGECIRKQKDVAESRNRNPELGNLLPS